MAHRFAAEGHDLVLIARDPGRLDTAAKAMRRNSGHRVMPLALDVTAADATQRLDAALGALGAYPDILVNNAGVGLAGPLHTQLPEDLTRLTLLNVTALTALCRDRKSTRLNSSHHAISRMPSSA